MESLFLQQFCLAMSKKHNTMSRMYGGPETRETKSVIPAYYETSYYTCTNLHTHYVTSYHISHYSYKPKKLNENNKNNNGSSTSIWGIVLYLNNGKSDWVCNNVHCKTGYIIIKNGDNPQKIENTENSDHDNEYVNDENKELEWFKKRNNNNNDNDNNWNNKNNQAIYDKIYKSVFNCDPNGDIVACGFELKGNNKWLWDSDIFNNDKIDENGNVICNDNKCHHHLISNRNINGNKNMTDIEHNAIITTFFNWYKYDIPTTFNKKDVCIFCQKSERKCQKIWHCEEKIYHKHGQSCNYISNADNAIGAAAVDCAIM